MKSITDEQIRDEAEYRYPEGILPTGVQTERKQRQNQRIFKEGAEWATKKLSAPAAALPVQQDSDALIEPGTTNVFKFREERDVQDEFRMIISHALLGCDTSDVPKETWDLVVSECTKYALSIKTPPDEPYEQNDFNPM